MKNIVLAAATVAGVVGWSGRATASPFTGFTETTDVFFMDQVEFDYDPVFLGGAISDFFGDLNIALATDLSNGTLLLTDPFDFSTVLEGALEDTALHVDDNIADDTFSMLFSITTGAVNYAIASFTGSLDGGGFTDFSTDGLFFEPGTLKITGATKDQAAVVPLPAGLPLMLAGICTLAVLRRRRC